MVRICYRCGREFESLVAEDLFNSRTGRDNAYEEEGYAQDCICADCALEIERDKHAALREERMRDFTATGKISQEELAQILQATSEEPDPEEDCLPVMDRGVSLIALLVSIRENARGYGERHTVRHINEILSELRGN